MKLAAIESLTLLDYPGHLACIVYTQGCNFRCSYCHNPELVSGLGTYSISEEDFFNFLNLRKGKLTGVCITGGEPTLQPDLKEFIIKVKELGFKVKLDTNGYRPEVLKDLLDNKLLDYVAMDIKGPLSKYSQITQARVTSQEICESIKLVISSSIDYEFRTTVVESLLTVDDFYEIGALLKGAKLYYLQKFVVSKTWDPEMMKAVSMSDEELNKAVAIMLSYVERCLIR